MSFNLWHRSQESIAQGCLTNSKHPKSHVYGVAPTHIIKAQGSYVWDQDNKQYVDYICGLGTNLFGYGNETVNRAAAQTMAMGVSHSLATQYEVVAAEKLKEVYPFIDRVKWLKTGSDACSAAIKVARAHTHRNIVLVEGYHGFHQEFCDFYNGTSKTMLAIDPTWPTWEIMPAAIIVEPVITDFSDARVAWLRDLSAKCTRHGVVLIFDEVITNLRWPKFGVCNWANIVPDIICGGKCIANGFPLAYVGGKKELMDNPSYFVSSTYAGDVVSLAAGTAVMTALQAKKFDIDRLWQAGGEFIGKFNAMAHDVVTLDAYPTRGAFKGTDLNVALFLQESVKAGLLFGKSWFFNFPHMAPAIHDQTFGALEGIFKKIRDGRAKLEGDMPVSPLAAKVRK